MAPPQLCVLCVEPLEAVALGECNHRDVCWLCTIKLRKFNGDNKCCICKVRPSVTPPPLSFPLEKGGIALDRRAGTAHRD